ncbi:MAG: metal-dependent hydrolase, partial [Elusimicrobia bacterium]|nr:metal-dependent hydrolase [Elusimicrobiota bacterium]
MDNLTHTLLGVNLANAGLSRHFGNGTVLILAIASNLTDLDAVWSFMKGGDSFLDRRMLTHSLVGFPLLAVLAAFLFYRRYPHLSWKTLFGLCFLGMG